MRRRQFIGLIGGAVAWPLAARAQQPDRMRRIGMLFGSPDGNSETDAFLDQFRKSLEKLGWSEQRNIKIDVRVASDVAKMRDFAAELVRLSPDVLVAAPTPATAAIKQQATPIPVVFVNVADPIASGFVESLAHPGGSMTGFTNFESSLGGKWVDLLHEIAPDLTRVALMFNPDTASGGAAGGIYLNSAKAATQQFKAELIVSPVYDDADIEKVFKSMTEAARGAVIVNPNVFNTVHRVNIVALAAQYKVPAIYPYRTYAQIGGLMAYGLERIDLFRGAASYVDRILRGERIRDLPVQQPTKFELVVNMKTANELGLDIPPTFLARVDDVIE